MTTPWEVAFVILSAIVLLLSLLVIGFFRRVSNVLEQAEARLSAPTTAVGSGLRPGSIVADFEAVDPAGRQVHGHTLLKSRRIYVFLSVDCEPCRTLLDDIRERGLRSENASIVAVLDDTTEARSLELPEGLSVIFQRDQSVSRAFETITTPHAFAVDESGVVVDVVVPNSADHLRVLARSPARHGSNPSDEAISAPAATA